MFSLDEGFEAAIAESGANLMMAKGMGSPNNSFVHKILRRGMKPWVRLCFEKTYD